MSHQSPKIIRVICGECCESTICTSSEINLLPVDRDDLISNITIGYDKFMNNSDELPNRILDLLQIAAYVFCSDRLAHRGDRKSINNDAWARSFEYHIPVLDLNFWKNEKTLIALKDALLFMTGDRNIEFVFKQTDKNPAYSGDKQLSLFSGLYNGFDNPGMTDVMLFSGGLDSLAGAIQRLNDFTDRSLCVVSHKSNRSTTHTQNALIILSVCVALYIIARRDKEAYKLTWVFLIMLFPLFGGVFYLLFGTQPGMRRFSRAVGRADDKVQWAYGLLDSACEDACETAPEHRTTIKYLENYASFPVYGNTSAKYLTPGEEKFACLMEELKKAEHYIFLEYFIVQEGIMWDSILDILKEKARAGVKVRMMYDDLGCFFTLPRDYPKKLREYGIECLVFNPFRPVLATVQNNRDHRKIAVIDGKVAFTGGINLADEYINAYEKHGHWKDASIMVEGKAAWSFALMFLKMWELCTGIDEDYLQYYPWRDSAFTMETMGYVQPYADSPLDNENTGEQVYLSIINGAKEYLYINTPYLIVDGAMAAALCQAAKSGVDVRIVTPHKWDKWAVHMTTRSYYRQLIQAGVKIYEYTKGFMHSKTFVADDAIATVGTTNLDFRSLYLHFECGAVLYGCPAIMEVKEDFLKTLTICQPITEQDCKCSLPMRLFQDVMRLFAPLM